VTVFTFEERIPICFNMMDKIVPIEGTYTWRLGESFSLYESHTNSFPLVRIWKLRKIEEKDDKVLITEQIYGSVASWLRSTVQEKCRLAHR
jgi:hypothetical protein